MKKPLICQAGSAVEASVDSLPPVKNTCSISYYMFFCQILFNNVKYCLTYNWAMNQ